MADRFCPRCSRPLPDGVSACPACGQPVAGGGGGGKWWVILLVGAGCAVVGVAVLGIVAAIVIPNFLDATQKAKQKRTLDEMRTIAGALESFQAQAGAYPEAADAAALAAQLAGHGYQGSMQDGWEKPLRWSCLAGARSGCGSYELASPGRDGVFESPPGGYEVGGFAPTAYDSDLVLGDGLFTRWPEGQGRLATGQ